MIRKILLGLIILVVVMQLFRPERNSSLSSSRNSLERNYVTSQRVSGILRTSCYDCHSNNTVYPWYSNFQPFAWWQQKHVNDGKKELNFDVFNTYTAKKKKHKLDEVIDVVQDDEMPLGSYSLIHRSAALSNANKDELITWARQLQGAIN
jgi:hypothetical protein